MPDPAVWGDVATWVTGALTGGSLLLGFSILRNDRAKEERAQAGRVAINIRVISDPGHRADHPDEAEVRLWNHSDLPIFQPTLTGLGYDLYLMADRPDEHYDPAVLPGSTRARRLSKSQYENIKHLQVRFRDANQVEWNYTMPENALRKERRRR